MEATLGSDEGGFEFEVEMITTCIRAGRHDRVGPDPDDLRGEPSHIRPLDHLRQFVRIVRKARRDVRAPLG